MASSLRFSLFAGFESDLLTNNMAILQMKTKYDLGPTIVPVCLPNGPDVMSQTDPTECYATGWGKPITGKIVELFRWRYETSKM